MAEEAQTRPPLTRLVIQAQTLRAQSAALRSQSAAERSRSQSLRSRWTAAGSRPQAWRPRLACLKAPAARRGQAGGRVFVSPATVRARVMLTSRELAAARRQAIVRAREFGLLGGQGST